MVEPQPERTAQSSKVTAKRAGRRPPQLLSAKTPEISKPVYYPQHHKHQEPQCGNTAFFEPESQRETEWAQMETLQKVSCALQRSLSAGLCMFL